MNAADFVSRLDKARQTGPGRWIACCPAHQDKRPSLAVRELDDGRTLLKCFGGCDVGAVTGALGLSVTDLFPDRIGYDKPQRRDRIPAADVLACVGHEALIVAIAGKAIAAGETLNAEDSERLSVAIARLQTAAEVAHG